MSRQKYKPPRRNVKDVAAKTVEVEAAAPAQSPRSPAKTSSLILFDLRTKIFLLAVIGLYFFFKPA